MCPPPDRNNAKISRRFVHLSKCNLKFISLIRTSIHHRELKFNVGTAKMQKRSWISVKIFSLVCSMFFMIFQTHRMQIRFLHKVGHLLLKTLWLVKESHSRLMRHTWDLSSLKEYRPLMLNEGQIMRKSIRLSSTALKKNQLLQNLHKSWTANFARRISVGLFLGQYQDKV